MEELCLPMWILHGGALSVLEMKAMGRLSAFLTSENSSVTLCGLSSCQALRSRSSHHGAWQGLCHLPSTVPTALQDNTMHRKEQEI